MGQPTNRSGAVTSGGRVMKVLAWSIITAVIALVIFIVVSGLMSSNPLTNLLATISTVLLGAMIVILLITWAIYEVFK